MSEEIKAGSVVMLKSGGPEMTVAWVSGSEVQCQWFDGSKALNEKFLITSLAIVPDE